MANATVPARGRWPDDPRVSYAFGDRATGNASLHVGSAGDAGRSALLAPFAPAVRHVAVGEQVHGAHVALIGAHDVTAAGASTGNGAAAASGGQGVAVVPAVDGLVTTTAGIALLVLTADCVPVLLAAGDGVAAVHAGRRGIEAGIVDAAVRTLATAAGVQPGAVGALIGPSIGACCYEVPAALAAAVADAAGAPVATRTSWDTPSLDLPAAVAAQLAAAGVQRVAVSGGCTRCHTDRWFSHRGTQANGADAGRNGSAIVRAAA